MAARGYLAGVVAVGVMAGRLLVERQTGNGYIQCLNVFSRRCMMWC